MFTLGINAAYHDTSACLVRDGRVIAAAEDERFTRIKHGKRPVPFTAWELPYHAIDYCLAEAGIALADVDHVAYAYDPYLLLDTRGETMSMLHLQGLGEPLMHPRFFDMVEYAVAKGVRVTTNTNLTLLNRNRALRVVECGLAELHASLDGATAKVYEAIRTRARYARVVANLEGLLAVRRARARRRPEITIVFVVMRRNLHELPELVRQAARWDVDAVFVQHLCHDFGESTLPVEYAPMRDFVGQETLFETAGAPVDETFALARETAQRLGLELRLPCFERKPPGCDWPSRGIYVSWEGIAMPCCMIGTPDRLSLGDMAADGVRSVWNGAAYRAFRERLASGNPHEICRSCSLYHGTF